MLVTRGMRILRGGKGDNLPTVMETGRGPASTPCPPTSATGHGHFQSHCPATAMCAVCEQVGSW